MKTVSLLALSLGMVSVSAHGGAKASDEPVLLGRGKVSKPVLDVTVAQMMEYDRSQKDKCGSEEVSATSCWTDADGNSFRYGCSAGDTRVYTDDSCDPGCGSCDGNWKWAVGEWADTCYDDGNYFYQYTCGQDSTPSAVEETEEPEEHAKPSRRSPKSCEKLGWPLLEEFGVCGSSKVENDDCAADSNWSTADQICGFAGGRLCMVWELENDVTKGTGCKGDCALVWTQDVCTTDAGSSGHFATAGSTKFCKPDHPSLTCVSDEEVLKMRCCADA